MVLRSGYWRLRSSLSDGYVMSNWSLFDPTRRGTSSSARFCAGLIALAGLLAAPAAWAQPAADRDRTGGPPASESQYASLYGIWELNFELTFADLSGEMARYMRAGLPAILQLEFRPDGTLHSRISENPHGQPARIEAESFEYRVESPFGSLATMSLVVVESSPYGGEERMTIEFIGEDEFSMRHPELDHVIIFERSAGPLMEASESVTFYEESEPVAQYPPDERFSGAIPPNAELEGVFGVWRIEESDGLRVRGMLAGFEDGDRVDWVSTWPCHLEFAHGGGDISNQGTHRWHCRLGAGTDSSHWYVTVELTQADDIDRVGERFDYRVVYDADEGTLRWTLLLNDERFTMVRERGEEE